MERVYLKTLKQSMKKLLLAIMSIYMEKKRNLYVIPTEKPSRLTIRLKTNELMYSYKEFVNKKYEDISLNQNQHIYITSNEEISGFENNIWVYNNGRVWLWENTMALRSNNKPRKIILTTDQDLIKDGVQAIDDEFLEWFVNNSNCKTVEVEEIYSLTCCIQKEGKTKMNNGCMERNRCLNYKIIIPQEEPKTYSCCGRCNGVDDICILDREEAKQRAANYMSLKGALEVKEETTQAIDKLFDEAKSKFGNTLKMLSDSSTDETLEEADKWSLEKAEEFALERFKSDHKKGIVTWDSILEVLKVGVKTGHKFGAKWQAERMYSKEEVLKMLNIARKICSIDGNIDLDDDILQGNLEGFSMKYTVNELIEQFKKK